MNEEKIANIPLWEQPQVQTRRWWILAVMCLNLVLVIMAVSGLNVALPTIQQELATTGTELLWIVDAYAIVFAGLLLTAGALGDRYGRKGALQFGLVIFALGALAAGVGSTAAQVIFGRAVMGAGAAFIMPATLSMVTVVFPPQERRKAIAVWAGFASAGGAIGPIISGILLTGLWLIPQFSWGATFIINIPVIIVALLAVTFIAPQSREAVRKPLDPIGSVVSITGISALLFAIIEGSHLGWLSPIVIASFVATAVLGVLFIWWEQWVKHPLLPLSLFQKPLFSIGSAVIALVFFVMIAFFLLITLYLQFVLGYSALAAGIATLPMALASLIIAPRTARLTERFGSGPVMSTGFIFIAVGLILLTSASTSTAYPLLFVAFILLGTGQSLAAAPATGNIMMSTPSDKAGVGSALNDTTLELGGALGIAFAGSLVATIYHKTIDLSSLGLPAEAVAAAGESIGGAFGAAAGIGGEMGAQIVLAAQEAFTSAFVWTMGIAALVAIISGLLTWWMMRGHETGQLAQPPKTALSSELA